MFFAIAIVIIHASAGGRDGSIDTPLAVQIHRSVKDSVLYLTAVCIIQLMSVCK